MVEQEQREANPPRSRVSDYHSVILEYNKKSKDNHSLEVTLIDGIENDDWQWKLQYENHVKCTQVSLGRERVPFTKIIIKKNNFYN